MLCLKRWNNCRYKKVETKSKPPSMHGPKAYLWRRALIRKEAYLFSCLSTTEKISSSQLVDNICCCQWPQQWRPKQQNNICAFWIELYLNSCNKGILENRGSRTVFQGTMRGMADKHCWKSMYLHHRSSLTLCNCRTALNVFLVTLSIQVRQL